jgi:hypothetical protein
VYYIFRGNIFSLAVGYLDSYFRGGRSKAMKTSHVRKVVVRVLGILVLSIFMIGAGEVMGSHSKAFAAIWNCTPNQVYTTDVRVHVRCTAAASGGIYYFATSTADPAEAARVLNVITAAVALGRNIDIWYNTDSAYNPPGCLVGDCRLLESVAFGQ